MSVFRKTSFIVFFLIAALITFVGRSALKEGGDDSNGRKRITRTPYDRRVPGKNSASKNSRSGQFRPQSATPLEYDYDSEGRPFSGEKDLDPSKLMKILPQHLPNAAVFQLVPPAK